MARRSDHNKQELMQLALQAGEAVLCEHGLAGFSTRAVAAKMGYTVGTLYHLFGDLNGFLLHLNARTLDALHDALLHTQQQAQERGEHSIHALAQCYVRFACEHQALWLTLFEHHLPDDATIPEWFQPKMQQCLTVLSDALQAYVPASEVILRTRLLWSGVHGIVMLHLQHKLDITGNDSVEQLSAAMVDALLAATSHPSPH
jgi:AcrR family transcriptional regulator